MVHPALPDDNRDPLTGAVTEAALLRFTEAVLELAEREGPPVCLLRIAIDGLERIGAALGGATRDALLLGAADRLHENVRHQDLVGRVADGFGICMPDLLAFEAGGVAERLRRRLSATPLATPGGGIGVTCSIGVAFAHGPGGPDASALVAAAGLALAAAQAAGGDRVVAAAAEGGPLPFPQGSG